MIFAITYIGLSIRTTPQGQQALVERLGRYHRKLRPGINFIVPGLDKIVYQGSLKETILEISPFTATTKDYVKIQANIIVNYKVLDIERTFYEIDDYESGIISIAVSVVRSEIGRINFNEISSAFDEIVQVFLDAADILTEPWGIKPTNLGIVGIIASEEYTDSQRSLEIAKRSSSQERENLVLEGESIANFASSLREALPSVSEEAILNYIILYKYFSKLKDFEETELNEDKQAIKSLKDIFDMSALIKYSDKDTSKNAE
ncbi:SPFH/Band 7/PHB domain protein [Oscillatoria sp. CS-180]|uniref:SPFH domain-containing protein n=1 Tax=Oscillatoria sp. CS-180 TaxID=3021720 RepID=UPI00232AA7A7|nr:SPFH domain-containing protein [Oscillatoria sp. CS-180]MDB9529911.1 SPFH/Band 7/PHB domain protein [Oscillatoria sp. CS-180]